MTPPAEEVPQDNGEGAEYASALRWLYGLQVHGIKLGLENMTRLCAGLGVQTESTERRKFIHVAGTNGKGSVCAILAAICCASGRRTALYTSPHLVSFRERIRLGENQIREDHVAQLVAEIRRITEAAGLLHQPAEALHCRNGVRSRG